MLEFFQKNKVKDKAKLRQALLDYHTEFSYPQMPYIPHHESDDFDSVLPALLTAELIADTFASHFEPSFDSVTANDFGSSGTFDAGGGFSGGGGASGDF